VAAKVRSEMSMLFDVWLIMHATTSLIDEALASTELSGDDFGLYSLLRMSGPVTPTQISRWSGMRPTTVSVALKRLQRRGHGESAPNPSDGRSYLVGLNVDGLAAHTAAAPYFLQAVDRLTAELGADQRSERVALRRIDAAFRAVLDLDPRPYDLGAEDDRSSQWHLRYDGPALTEEQEQDVRRYIDLLRSQRT
jgi:DNA-binding MarR family transcriptional regulator